MDIKNALNLVSSKLNLHYTNAEQLTQADQFDKLLENAFHADFRSSLTETAELGLAVGVAKGDLLTTTEEIDEFFL